MIGVAPGVEVGVAQGACDGEMEKAAEIEGEDSSDEEEKRVQPTHMNSEEIGRVEKGRCKTEDKGRAEEILKDRKAYKSHLEKFDYWTRDRLRSAKNEGNLVNTFSIDEAFDYLQNQHQHSRFNNIKNDIDKEEISKKCSLKRSVLRTGSNGVSKWKLSFFFLMAHVIPVVAKQNVNQYLLWVILSVALLLLASVLIFVVCHSCNKTHSKKDDEEEPFIEKHGNQEDEAPSIASLRERLFGSKNNLPRQKGGGIEGENNVHNYTVDLDKRIGSGSMSNVFIGTYNGRAVAAKKFQGFDTRTKNVLEKEFRILSKLRHENIIEVFHFDNNTDTLLLELCFVTDRKGKKVFDLKEWSQTCEAKSAATYASILKQATAALNYLHQQKVLHSDVKPQNILCTGDFHSPLLKMTGRIFIGQMINVNGIFPDFGSAMREAIEALAVSKVSGIGGDFGTDLYRAPETFKRNRSGKTKSNDVYALAFTLADVLNETPAGENIYGEELLQINVYTIMQVKMDQIVPKFRIPAVCDDDNFIQVSSALKTCMEGDPNKRMDSEALYKIMLKYHCQIDQTLMKSPLPKKQKSVTSLTKKSTSASQAMNPIDEKASQAINPADTSFVPENLEDELGEADDMSVDELLKTPEPEEQEREKEEEIRFRKQAVESERKSQISQMMRAQIDAEAEQVRRSTQDFKRLMEENKKARREFDGSLKKEDVEEILNAEFLNEVKKSSRHQDFHSGSRKYEELFKRNLGHILSDEKADEVTSQLKKKFKLSLGKDADNYINHVLFPEAVIELYARAFQLSKADAEEKLMNTGADIDFSPPPTQQARVIRSPSDNSQPMNPLEERASQAMNPDDEAAFQAMNHDDEAAFQAMNHDDEEALLQAMNSLDKEASQPKDTVDERSSQEMNTEDEKGFLNFETELYKCITIDLRVSQATPGIMIAFKQADVDYSIEEVATLNLLLEDVNQYESMKRFEGTNACAFYSTLIMDTILLLDNWSLEDAVSKTRQIIMLSQLDFNHMRNIEQTYAIDEAIKILGKRIILNLLDYEDLQFGKGFKPKDENDLFDTICNFFINVKKALNDVKHGFFYTVGELIFSFVIDYEKGTATLIDTHPLPHIENAVICCIGLKEKGLNHKDKHLAHAMSTLLQKRIFASKGQKTYEQFHQLDLAIQDITPGNDKRQEGLQDFEDNVRPDFDLSMEVQVDVEVTEGEDFCPETSFLASEVPSKIVLRDYQQEVLKQVLQSKDILMVWPTGAGKTHTVFSLIEETSGATMILTPTLSLMLEYIKQLERRSISFLAGSSLQTLSHQALIVEICKKTPQCILLTHEQMESWGHEGLTIINEAKQVEQIIYDEVHCDFLWGGSLRPSMKEVHNLPEALKFAKRIALTATPIGGDVENTIKDAQLRKPFVSKRSLFRPNIKLEVFSTTDHNAKTKILLEKVLPSKKTIIFTSFTDEAKTLADQFRSITTMPVYVYTGTSSMKMKVESFEEFEKADSGILIATAALGIYLNIYYVSFQLLQIIHILD